MHHGIYTGKSAEKQEKKILILGESHHNKNSEGVGKPASYTTRCVVEEYLNEKTTGKTHRFFHKIVQSFGVDTTKAEEKVIFWDKVYFGNYIDVVCGVKDNAAKAVIKQNKNMYNSELIEFINKNGIDIICCFSRLVYKNLPAKASFENKEITIEVPYVGKRRDYIKKFVYLPGERKDGTTSLKKPLTVYGLRHPSSGCGYNPANYSDYLQKEIKL